MMEAVPGRRDEVIALFERLAVFDHASSVSGFVSGELLASQESPDALMVTATWATNESYDEWLASPKREEMRPELECLLTRPPESLLFRVVARQPTIESRHEAPA
jgi:heme-degrading monooxygenase HmoA